MSTSNYISDTSKDYAIYVAENRAIPKVADGLKDGQRKMLWLMRTRQDKIKTVSLSGESISSGLFLHGDASASQSISQMAGPFCNNICYLEGIGAFGTRVDPTGFGAPRYTYVKRPKYMNYLLYKDLEIVPLKDNYDGSTKEPIHFLPIIPTVLLNGISGIAVGWSTEILPRKIDDLINACKEVLQGKKKLSPINPYYANYDIEIKKQPEDNSWIFTGKAKKVDNNCIKIHELPPEYSLEKLKERLNKMEEEGQIQGYIDNSSENIDVEVKFKRGEINNWNHDKIVNFFKLSQKKSERIVVVSWNNKSIKQYDSPDQLIRDFVEFRLTWYKERYINYLKNDSYELCYWKALKECFDKDLPKKIQSFKNKAELEDNIKQLTKKIGIDQEQMDKIAVLPTFKWAQDYYKEIQKNIKELESNIVEYNKNLKDPNRIKSIYIDELEELRKEVC